RAVSSRVVFKLAITRNIHRCWGHSYCVVTLKQGRAMLRMMLRNLPRTYRKHKLAHLRWVGERARHSIEAIILALSCT
ncbi:Uncharacterized protein APZ42_008280, partial [Daphnia magna]